MARIKNKNYRKFLDQGIIETINEDTIKQALNNIKGKRKKEGRALLITLYYTGARPNEILRLKTESINKDKSYLVIKMPASKNGLPRSIYLQLKKPLIKELYNFCQSIPPNMYLFYNYRSKYTRTRKTKKGITQYTEIADSLRYHFNKWFEGIIPESIPPYFLRHNRFSKLSEAGLDMQDIRILKGAKTYNSVMPYLHMSTKSAKKIAKKME